MLRTTLGQSCMNRSSDFEWHKSFKEGRESVRDDERCGTNKEVRTLELIGQIKNFMDKDRRVSIKTIRAQFDISMGTVHTIIREELKMWKICVKFVPRVLREDQKERRCHDSREMVELINSDPAVLDALLTCDESWFYCYHRPRDRVPSGSMLALPDPRRPDRANPPTDFWGSLFFDSNGMIYMHWVPTGQTLDKEYYVEVLREFRRDSVWRDQHSILVTDYLIKRGIKIVRHPPYSSDLAPCDFCFFPKLKEKLRGCCY